MAVPRHIWSHLDTPDTPALIHWLLCLPGALPLQAMEQMKTTSTQQQQMMHGLLKERQLLQQQVQLLQQQARDQAEKLRRSQLQKQRLEGLCRGLQVHEIL